MSFVFYNPNPARRSVGDCTVRALSKALGQSWEKTYAGLALEGFRNGDMPSANAVWGAYLRAHGFARRMLPEDCTVADFAAECPHGTYILALDKHVVCVRDGDWYDTWDSGGEIPLYYWERNES